MNADFISAIQELGKEKGIEPELLYQAVEDALVAAYKKNSNTNQNVRVDMNKETGEIHVYAQRTVVEGEPVDETEMSLEDAHALDARYMAGDIVETEVTPKNFGRIAAQNAKQVVVQRIREAERGQVYERFQSRNQDIVTGIIERQENKNVYIDLGKVEAVLEALRNGADFACVHVEAPDECAHGGDVEGKCEAIRRLEVEDFPAIVVIDAEGNNLYETGRANYLAQCPKP